MKRIITLLFFIPLLGLAQNTAPIITINNATIDTTAKTININYNALDLDNDLMEVKAWLSADSGLSYVSPIQLATGALGYPVTPGSNKTIVINYNTDSLYYAANGNANAWFMIKIVASDRKPVSVQNMLPAIDSTLVYEYMQYIAQPRHHTAAPQGLIMIKDSIEANFARHHLQTTRMRTTYLDNSDLFYDLIRVVNRHSAHTEHCVESSSSSRASPRTSHTGRFFLRFFACSCASAWRAMISSLRATRSGRDSPPDQVYCRPFIANSPNDASPSAPAS